MYVLLKDRMLLITELRVDVDVHHDMFSWNSNAIRSFYELCNYLYGKKTVLCWSENKTVIRDLYSDMVARAKLGTHMFDLRQEIDRKKLGDEVYL